MMQEKDKISTDILIVGAGPAGASLAAFLANYGIKGLCISSAPGTADTPRAHITNLSALDALRDLGVHEECYRLGNRGEHMMHYRWCETMAEEEYGRIYSWGNDPKRIGDYAAASPNPGVLDLPQTLLEPILVRFATTSGFKVQFNTQFISLARDSKTGRYTVMVKDLIRDVTYEISCKYLFGADGGRSPVAEQLKLPMHTVGRGGGIATNVLIRCDIEHLMIGRQGNLHWNLRLKRDDPWMFNTRMVKPWKEWLLVSLPKDPSYVGEPWTKEMWEEAWRDLINDWEIPVEIVSISTWKVNEVCAEKYSDGNVFCLGDAVHRHPPTNGLGSNTCIGDAFNLAWKLNLVMKGIASSSLLDTYSIERQPVGAEVVRETNERLIYHVQIWQELGMQPPGKTVEERTAGLKIMKEDSTRGRAARLKLRDLALWLDHETHALGLEMGQRYDSSAVYLHDEEPWTPPRREAEDRILYYEPCTYPGRRLPHVWLAQNLPIKKFSTLDLAGKGNFTLFTGIGGSFWKEAALEVGKELGLLIKVVSIGSGQDWEDTYWDWSLKSGVDDTGAVLVRPDLFCAWRAKSRLKSQEECSQKLMTVMKSVLGI